MEVFAPNALKTVHPAILTSVCNAKGSIFGMDNIVFCRALLLLLVIKTHV